MANCLWSHGLQHARLFYPSLSPKVYSYSCPLSQWCHPTISFSVIPFSSRPQSFPASGSFPMSHFFASKYWSFSFSISPSNEYSGLISLTMDWLDLLAIQGTLKSLLLLLLLLLPSHFRHVHLCVTPETAAHQAPLENPWDSTGKNTGVGCHFLL